MTTPNPSSQQHAQPEPQQTAPVQLRRSSSSNSMDLSHPSAELRSQINAQLLSEGHCEKLHTHLTHALSSDPHDFPTRLRQHALNLLHDDPTITTFPHLMARVLSDIRADNESARRARRAGVVWDGMPISTGVPNSGLNVLNVTDGDGGVGGEAIGRGHGPEGRSLAVPRGVVEEGMRAVRESLESIVEVEP